MACVENMIASSTRRNVVHLLVFEHRRITMMVSSNGMPSIDVAYDRLTCPCFIRVTEEDNYTPPKVFDHVYCEELSHHLLHAKSLPEQCKKFIDVVTYLKRHDTDTTHGTQILS